jgi:hypothetical protein
VALGVTEKKAVISFGKGVRLMSEEYYIAELRPFGVNTTRAFRALCRAICCPTIILGKTGFVDPAVFQICIKHLSLPGRHDFLGPNSYVKTYKKRQHIRNRVNPADLERDWKRVVRMILDSRRLVGHHVPDADKVAIRTAAAELSRFVLTMIPSHTQGQADGKESTAQEAESREADPE